MTVMTFDRAARLPSSSAVAHSTAAVFNWLLNQGYGRRVDDSDDRMLRDVGLRRSSNGEFVDF